MSYHVSTPKKFGETGKFLAGFAIFCLLVSLAIQKYCGPSSESPKKVAGAKVTTVEEVGETESSEIEEIRLQAGERVEIEFSKGRIVRFPLLPNHKFSSSDPEAEDGCLRIEAERSSGYYQDCPGKKSDRAVGFAPRASGQSEWVQFRAMEEDSVVKIWVKMIPQ
jgi:hypothetical protein